MATPLCLETGCKFARKEHKDSETIRCILCMNWFHVKCVDETHPKTIHTCISCRNTHSYVKNIMLSMTVLIEKIDRIDKTISNLGKDHDTLFKKFDDVQKENESTKADNAILHKEILSLRAELHEVRWPLQPSDNQAKPIIVIGSSVLRDIDNEKIKNTIVHSISGGKIGDALQYVNDLPAGKYSTICLLIGGNDCDEPQTPTADIIKSYNELIGNAMTKCTNVTVASILPRRCPDNANISDRIDTVNAELQVLCADRGCNFIDNNTAFKLQDGSLNDGYYLIERQSPKLIHLNDRGTTKLCEILNIKPKDTKVTKDRIRNRTAPPRNHHTPETSKQKTVSEPHWSRRNPASRGPPRHDFQAPADFPEQRAPARPRAPSPARHPPPARPTPRVSPRTADHSPSGSVVSGYESRLPHTTQYAPPRHAPQQHYTQPTHDYKNSDQQYYDRYLHVGCYNCSEPHGLDRCWYTERLMCLHCKCLGHKEKNCPYTRQTPQYDYRPTSPSYTHDIYNSY